VGSELRATRFRKQIDYTKARKLIGGPLIRRAAY